MRLSLLDPAPVAAGDRAARAFHHSLNLARGPERLDYRAWLASLLCLFLFSSCGQKVSNDRDLKEIDLTKWQCLEMPGGTGKTPASKERNAQKNRAAPSEIPLAIPKFDFAGFLQHVGEFTPFTKKKRRKDLTLAQKGALASEEGRLVELTGYLGIAYCGGQETTNCRSVDFHDWHLEIFENPPEHSLRPGDATPIVCEITPRTQNALQRDHVSIHALAGFFRRPDMVYEATGHPARKIRLTGYLLWDDEHSAPGKDIGKEVLSKKERPWWSTWLAFGRESKFHHPWRRTAWEIHPVIKIEAAEPITPASLSSTHASGGEASP